MSITSPTNTEKSWWKVISETVSAAAHEVSVVAELTAIKVKETWDSYEFQSPIRRALTPTERKHEQELQARLKQQSIKVKLAKLQAELDALK